MASASGGDIAIAAPMATNASDEIVYLHGDLELKIHEARGLPNMDLLTEHLRRCLAVCDTCRVPTTEGNRNHRPHRKISTTDPYVKVLLAGATLACTRVIPNSQDPVWEQRFHIPLAHPFSPLEFQVKDNDVFGAQLIGVVLVPVRSILSGELINEWFPVIGPYGRPPKRDTSLHLEMKFTPVESNPLYQHGIAADPNHLGVRNTYFTLRRGCSVTLYQDAHVREGELPVIELEKGKVFEHQKCWEDICHAILEAHRLVYIMGWSVYHNVKLVREPTPGRLLPRGWNQNLGELLKYKSREGVRVLLLVWDDNTSHSKFFIKTAGVMQTHDEETRKFFKHSSVICVLSPRYASSKLGIVKQKILFRSLS